MKEAENYFAALFEKKNIQVELPIIKYDSTLFEGDYSLIDCIFSTGKYKSKSDVRRLIQQGAVKINGEKYSNLQFVPQNNMIISVGKGTSFELIDRSEKLVENNKR